MRLGDVHEDMERFLREDCYCPGEIYDLSGFFYRVYEVSDECRLIERSEDRTAIVATTVRGGEEDPSPQAIMFWHDEGDGRIIDAQRVDATENNVGILRSIVRGEEPDGCEIDEFEPGDTARQLRKVLSMCDAVMVDA